MCRTYGIHLLRLHEDAKNKRVIQNCTESKVGNHQQILRFAWLALASGRCHLSFSEEQRRLITVRKLRLEAPSAVEQLVAAPCRYAIRQATARGGRADAR